MNRERSDQLPDEQAVTSRDAEFYRGLFPNRAEGQQGPEILTPGQAFERTAHLVRDLARQSGEPEGGPAHRLSSLIMHYADNTGDRIAGFEGRPTDERQLIVAVNEAFINAAHTLTAPPAGRHRGRDIIFETGHPQLAQDLRGQLELALGVPLTEDASNHIQTDIPGVALEYWATRQQPPVFRLDLAIDRQPAAPPAPAQNGPSWAEIIDNVPPPRVDQAAVPGDTFLPRSADRISRNPVGDLYENLAFSTRFTGSSEGLGVSDRRHHPALEQLSSLIQQRADDLKPKSIMPASQTEPGPPLTEQDPERFRTAEQGTQQLRAAIERMAQFLASDATPGDTDYAQLYRGIARTGASSVVESELRTLLLNPKEEDRPTGRHRRQHHRRGPQTLPTIFPGIDLAVQYIPPAKRHEAIDGDMDSEAVYISLIRQG